MAEVEHGAEAASTFILFQNLPKMRELIDLDDLLIYLTAEGLLTDNDIQKLKVVPPFNTRDVVIRELALLVKQKGENGLVKFMSALKKSVSQGNQSGHQDLLQILESPGHPTTTENPTAVSPAPPTEAVRHDAWKEARADSESINTPPHSVAHTHTQVTHRRVRHKKQEMPVNQKFTLEQHPDPNQSIMVTDTNERDVLHELGCQLFNTCQYHAFRRYDYSIRTLARCLCVVLLIYQFVAMTIVTLCEDGGFLTVFQNMENRRGIVLHCFLLFVLRIGTRVIIPVLFMSQLDTPATKPPIPKSRLNIHEAMQQIFVAYKTFSPRRHRERIKSKQSDPSAVIDFSAGLVKRHIRSSWIAILHSFLFTWLLFYLGAFSMAADKVAKGQGICNVASIYTTTIHLPLVSSPIPLSVLGECVSILAILLLVGILKEFYLYENRIATYALVLGDEGEKLHDMFRERWGTLDMYCYSMPLVLSVLAGLTLFSGKGLTPEPPLEIEAIAVLNWYFWVFILSALTFLATFPNIWFKVACLISYAVIAILIYAVKIESPMIPAAGDCAVILLCVCHAVLLFNFHTSLLKCHYYHYRQTNSAASIYRQAYCLMCMLFLVVCVCITVHWEVTHFGRYLLA